MRRTGPSSPCLSPLGFASAARLRSRATLLAPRPGPLQPPRLQRRPPPPSPPPPLATSAPAATPIARSRLRSVPLPAPAHLLRACVLALLPPQALGAPALPPCHVSGERLHLPARRAAAATEVATGCAPANSVLHRALSAPGLQPGRHLSLPTPHPSRASW